MSQIDQLRTFLAVHRSGSVTEAARFLHMSQPAVSQQLRALEEIVGRPLFRRIPRGMEPTPAASELAQLVGAHLDSVEEAWGQWHGAAGAGDDLAGSLVLLGGPSEFLVAQVLPALAELVERGLRLRVRVGDDAIVSAALMAREIDLAILTVPIQHAGVEVERLAREEFVLVGSPLMARRLGEVKSGKRGARQLSALPLLAYAEELPLVGPYWREVFGMDPDGVAAVVADSLPALVALAEAGLGITVLPGHVARDPIRAGRLVQLCTPRVPPAADLYVAWWSGTRRSKALAIVHEHLRHGPSNLNPEDLASAREHARVESDGGHSAG